MLPPHAGLLSALCGYGYTRVESAPGKLLLLWAGAQYAIAFAGGLSCRGHWLLGKDTKTGQIPLWLTLFWAPVHLAKTVLKSKAFSKVMGKKRNAEGATEIIPGWWVGGRTADDVGQKFQG